MIASAARGEDPIVSLADGAGRLVCIPQVAPGAVLSADLTRLPWTRASRLTGLLGLNARSLAAAPTWVYACYDTNGLWLAYRCEGVDGRTLKTEVKEPDGRVWWDDAVECYWDPAGLGRSFMQVAVNAAGVVYDARNRSSAWKSDARVVAASDAAGFTVAMCLPFAAMEQNCPQAGTAWRANFARNGPGCGPSSWTWAYNTLQSAGQFGTVVFGGAAVPTVRVRSLAPVAMGANRIGLDDTTGLACRIAGLDREGRSVFDVVARREKDGFSFDLVSDAVRTVSVRIEGPAGQPLAGWWSEVESPELGGRLAAWVKSADIMSQMAGRFPAEVAERAAAAAREVRSRVDAAARIAGEKPAYSAARWRELEAILAALDREYGDVAAHARTLEHFPEARFGIGFQSPMQRVMIEDFPFDGWFDGKADVCLAANEHEAVQVVAMPWAADLAEVRVAVSMQAGSQVSAAVSLVGHVDVNDDPPYETAYKGLYPDPLLGFLDKAAVKAREHVAFWVDIKAARRVKGGDYRGTIVVSARGCPPVRIPLNVHVWGFELPDGTHLKNAFTYHEAMIRSFYRKNWEERFSRAYQDLVLDHRLGIDHLYRHEPPDLQLLKYAVARGMNAFNIVFAGGGRIKQHVLDSVRTFLPSARKAGLDKLAYIYGFDEIKPDRFDEAREAFGLIHRDFPGVPTMTTAQDHTFGRESGLRDVVDIWVPLTPSYDLKEAEQLRREGRQMWWYICLVPIHPYANWFVEYPAIESRLLMGAMSHRYRVDGFLYYLLNNHWDRNRAPITTGPRTGWDPASCPNSKDKWANGDGNLFYPGPNGPVSSIRLENIRDGLEDYEYLYLLADHVRRMESMPPTPVRKGFLNKARPLLVVPDLLVRNVVEYTRDPAILGAWRSRLAACIEEAGTLK
jgi:hypothetical protein